MPDIRYVCLSDMHLGADNSVLTTVHLNNSVPTTDPMTVSPTLSLFVECLRALISQNENPEKPTLVLNGDILEMALTDTNKAAMVFERFIELVLPANGEALFDEKNIFYLPGNHDHHIWESAREMLYAQYIAGVPPGKELPAPWHTTRMFQPDAVPEIFLNTLLHRYPHLKDASIQVIYPNYALVNGQRCVIFSHGHYVEAIYSLMTTLNTMFFPGRTRPKFIWDLEAENFAWIDFFWSTMGRSGAVGTDVEVIYDKLQNESQLRLMISNLASGLSNKPGRAGWKNWLEARLLRKVFSLVFFAVKNAERSQTEDYLTNDAKKGLREYIEGPVLKQIKIERNQNVPPNVAFIFGHTHKPFQCQMRFEGYEPGANVYNTGGWVIDSVDLHPLVGGAVVLVDENLDLTSLHMYNEAADSSAYAVSVQTATTSNDAKNPFHERIAGLVDSAKDPWRTFSEVTASEIPRRVANLKSKIAQW